MKTKIEIIIKDIKAAEQTSSFKPAAQVQHLKNALNGAISLMSEVVDRVELLEAKINGE